MKLPTDLDHMKHNELIDRKSPWKAALAGAAIGWMCWNGAGICQAQTPPPPALSPDLQEVVTLSQQHMSDDVIVSYIRNSGKAYRLGASDIVYLANQGVSQNVIMVLQQAAPAAAPMPAPAPMPAAPAPVAPVAPIAAAPAPAVVVAQAAPAATVTVQVTTPGVAVQVASPTPPPPPAPEINFQYFHDQLAPWGTWIDLPGTGWVWRPGDAVFAASPGWRPYYDNGQWVQTENGLFWQSDYTWGDIPFHYGRWMLNPVYGWVWAPDYVWGPAWVFWRHDEVDGAVGWCALPPGAVIVDDGFIFHGAHVGFEFDFGLGEDCFVFVEGGHFHERFFRLRGREWRYHIDHEHLHGFFHRSVVRNEFHRDEHGRFVNNGIGRDRMEHMNPHIQRAGFEERHPVGDRDHAGPAGHPEPDHPAPGHPEAGHPEPGHPEAGHGAAAPGGAAHPGAAPAAQPSKVFRPPTPAATPAARPAAGATPAAGGASQHSAPASSPGGSKKK